MNWTTLLRFRKQVEDVVREEVIVAEQEHAKKRAWRSELRRHLDDIAVTLESQLQEPTDIGMVSQQYDCLESTGNLLEEHAQKMHDSERQLAELRKRLQQAHHARRVVEIVISKKDAELQRKIGKYEQSVMEEVSAHAYVARRGAEQE